MKNFFSIAIPNPCHENWNHMTPEAKGRYCNSCAKTVIDFTKMDTYKIQNFIFDNQENRICGHFNQTQLNSVNLRIPLHVIAHPKSFYKSFILALLIAMGPSLMSCTNKHGETRKIDSIEIVDSLTKQIVKIEDLEKTCTTSSTNTKDSILKPPIDLPDLVDGMLFTETVGDIDIIEEAPTAIDSVEVIELEEFEEEVTLGIIITEEEEKIIPLHDDHQLTLDLHVVDSPPEFPSTPKNLSIEEKRHYFIKRISQFIDNNIEVEQLNSFLKERQRFTANFIIDKFGVIQDIRIRSPHARLEQLTLDVLQKLPKLIPAKHKGKPVNLMHTLPILFQLED